MMLATPCLVHFRSAYDDYWVIITGRPPVDQALSARGGLAAHHTDGLKFLNMFSKCQQEGHAAKRLAAKILVQSGDDDPDAAVRQGTHDGDDFFVEELSFVDPNYGCVGFKAFEDFGGSLNGGGVKIHPGM